MSNENSRRLVWDLPLRLFHWLFALTILASWATGKAGFEWTPWHMRLGYWMIGLLIFRLIWGFVGPRHARFSSFVASPRRAWSYLRRLFGAGTVLHSVGHNPLGGFMVIVMLLLVAFQATTGLFSTDDIVWTGPYNSSVSGATAQFLTKVHHANFNFILAAVTLHIAAILFYAFVKKQNLVPAMITGWKPAEAVPADQAIASSQLLKAIIVIAVSSAAVYFLLSAAPTAPADNTF
jgi:cytochrome b